MRFMFAVAFAALAPVLLLLVSGTSHAAGDCSITKTRVGSTTFVNLGQPWPSVDGAPATGVKVDGSLSYTSGPPLSGSANAMCATSLDGSITNLPNRPDGTQAGQWKVNLTARMRVTASADPYAAGAGSYSSNGKANLRIVKPDLTNADSFKTVSIVNEVDHDSAGASVTYGTASTPQIINGNTLALAWSCYGEGSITTSRPEATIKIKSWMQQPFTGSAVAYDSSDPAAPIQIHIYDADGNDITTQETTLN